MKGSKLVEGEIQFNRRTLKKEGAVVNFWTKDREIIGQPVFLPDDISIYDFGSVVNRPFDSSAAFGSDADYKSIVESSKKRNRKTESVRPSKDEVVDALKDLYNEYRAKFGLFTELKNAISSLDAAEDQHEVDDAISWLDDVASGIADNEETAFYAEELWDAIAFLR